MNVLLKLAIALLLGTFSVVVFSGPNDMISTQRNYAEILAKGEISMAVPYDRSIYVDAKGQKLGAAPFMATYLGKFLTEKYKKNIRVTIVPTIPGQLVKAIDHGQADFSYGYVDEYAQKLDASRYFVFPHPRHEKHVLVSNSSQPPISKLVELSGDIVCLGHQTDTPIFNELNTSLQQTAKKSIHVYKDHLVLDDEDLLQMLNDGLIPHVYVAEWKAKLWKPLLKNIRINDETATPGNTTEGVIVGGNNKALSEDILSFVASPYLDTALNNYRNDDFKFREHTLKNPAASTEWARYKSMKSFFDRYAPENNIEPVYLAALGFQETMLDQSLVSPMGAIGVMQLLPATGASMRVGDIHQLDSNIHAGAKYIGSLLKSMSIDDQFTWLERGLFATAAYNAGPNNIRKAREQAGKLGFDPNKWFLNVEMMTAKMFGLETFFYVRNVYKYYVTYDVREKKIQLDQERLVVDSKKLMQ
jgi:membrane-bound lytic murein transglycosylase MltF